MLLYLSAKASPASLLPLCKENERPYLLMYTAERNTPSAFRPAVCRSPYALYVPDNPLTANDRRNKRIFSNWWYSNIAESVYHWYPRIGVKSCTCADGRINHIPFPKAEGLPSPHSIPPVCSFLPSVQKARRVNHDTVSNHFEKRGHRSLYIKHPATIHICSFLKPSFLYSL